MQRSKFESREPSESRKTFSPLPSELWQAVLECTCAFGAEIFNLVMLNLIQNPNVTSTHLFRADIFYDSDKDPHFSTEAGDSAGYNGLAKHLKAEYQPIPFEWPNFTLERTIVRQLIPRNAQLDRPMVQTCHFFHRQTEAGGEESLVLYIPHVIRPEDMPFYHPAVSRLGFLHTWEPNSQDSDLQDPPGSLTILCRPFPSEDATLESTQLPAKFDRTALRILETIHRHGHGELIGYEKRVHHDRVVPQKRYQDTYARLKAAYGRKLTSQWVEATDPGKHVFEDLGIAAFLIELWRDMYSFPVEAAGMEARENQRTRPDFPGFVDIGCGNGLLVHILASEGYPGWGFDARERKSWPVLMPDEKTEDPSARRLQQRILVPEVFQSAASTMKSEPGDIAFWHDGIFPPGTFIISNHADELTPWTPLLAFLNSSPFIAIPCCSHDLAGARFRAPVAPANRLHPAPEDAAEPVERLPQQRKASSPPTSQAAETGSLKRTSAQQKIPSAYASLCGYVTRLAEEMGFEPEQEVLRIPSTRNHCIIGRRRSDKEGEKELMRRQKVVSIVERELKTSLAGVADGWIEHAAALTKKKGSGH